jgi:hypothetical protein
MELSNNERLGLKQSGIDKTERKEVTTIPKLRKKMLCS